MALREGNLRTSVYAIIALASFAAVLLAAAPRSSAQSADECLVGVNDQASGYVADGATLCAEAQNKKCTFNLALCLNLSQSGCDAGEIKTEKGTACGRKLKKAPRSGTDSACGSFVGVKVKTKKHGTAERTCVAKVRAKTKGTPARKDSDTVTLVCEPTGTPCPSTTTTTTISTGSTTTTMQGACNCCGSLPSLLSFTTASSGCGTNPPGSVSPAVCVQGTNNGTPCTTDADCTGGGVCLGHLDCTGLYFGAGRPAGIGLPGTIPDLGLSYSMVASCTAGNPDLTATTAADVPGGCPTPTGTATYGQRHCTSPGCLFGAPLAIPNPSNTATGTCVVNFIANRPGAGTGSAVCSTGSVNSLTLPLDSQIYLTGSLEPVRVCSSCVGGTPGMCGSGTCMGGPRNGMACTPETNALNGSYPTSHDCPPPNAPNGQLVSGCPAANGSFIGCLPVDFGLSTETQTKTAFSTSGQARVFCGYCFDPDITLSFENPPHTCTADTDCTNGSFTSCQQQSNGAFRNTFATTVTETGTPPNACIADGADHNATLVSVFCIPPSYDPIVDPSGELPGPGAVSLPGTSKFLP